MTDINVALEAMRSDAVVWEAAADRVEGPQSTVTGLVLTGAELSVWAVDRGVDRLYNDTRARVEDLLHEASTGFRALADSLRAAADTYEREEEMNLHRFKKIE